VDVKNTWLSSPGYEIPLKKDRNTIAYKVSTTSHDFGDVPFTEMKTMEFKIENTGNVNI
jgi:hypothetical protein